MKPVSIPEKQLMENAVEALAEPPDALAKTMAMLGESAGPTWGKDQKDAALGALVALKARFSE